MFKFLRKKYNVHGKDDCLEVRAHKWTVNEKVFLNFFEGFLKRAKEDPTRKMACINMIEAEVTVNEGGNLRIYIIRSHEHNGVRLARYAK